MKDRDWILACLQGLARVAAIEQDQTPFNLLRKSLEPIRVALEHSTPVTVTILYRGEYIGDAPSKPSGNEMRAPIFVRGIEEGEIVRGRMEEIDRDEQEFDQALIDMAASYLSLILERAFAVGELEDLRLQLRHADRLATIGQLAAGVAHQINEPLGNILGFAELVKKASTLPEQSAADLDRIINASLNAREIIRKLMLFARQMPPERTRFTLDKIVNDSLQFFDSLCANQGIKIVRDLDNATRTVLADETQLRQVLINLIVNAIQAMKEGGTLTVRTRDEIQFVTLEVEDTGYGIAEELQEQVFVPFFTTKDVDEGTGLGLAIVHGIVRAHSGEIIVNSAPEQGASFLVRLPVDPTTEGVQ